jgi:hypothetical protein
MSFINILFVLLNNWRVLLVLNISFGLYYGIIASIMNSLNYNGKYNKKLSELTKHEKASLIFLLDYYYDYHDIIAQLNLLVIYKFTHIEEIK